MFWLGALLLAVTIIAFRAHRRRQLLSMQWPSPLRYYPMRGRVGKLFSLDRWQVIYKDGGGFPDCTIKRDGYQILIVCSPSGDYVGSGKLCDLNEFKRSQSGAWPILFVTAEIPEETRQEEAMQRGVFLIHYKELVNFSHRDVPTIRGHLVTLESALTDRIRMRTPLVKGGIPVLPGAREI